MNDIMKPAGFNDGQSNELNKEEKKEDAPVHEEPVSEAPKKSEPSVSPEVTPVPKKRGIFGRKK